VLFLDRVVGLADQTGRGRLAAKERVLKVVILVLCRRRQGVEGIVLLSVVSRDYAQFLCWDEKRR
jgi:hypothetical protein